MNYYELTGSGYEYFERIILCHTAQFTQKEFLKMVDDAWVDVAKSKELHEKRTAGTYGDFKMAYPAYTDWSGCIDDVAKRLCRKHGFHLLPIQAECHHDENSSPPQYRTPSYQVLMGRKWLACEFDSSYYEKTWTISVDGEEIATGKYK